MRLLLIRHAPAVPRDTPGIADDERPLTAKGTRKFRAAARGLARIARRPDVLLTSPLPRARKTAEIAAAAWKRLEPVVEPALAGDSASDIVAAVGKRGSGATVAIVGHEPVLSEVLAQLLGAASSDRLAFKKGGAALVDLPDGIAAGGQLIWFLKPKILRALAGD